MRRVRSLSIKTTEGSHKKKAFNNVVVCLTGFSSVRKSQLHHIVEKLGGRYTGDLVIEHTTHLIAEVAEGPKHHEAARTNHIFIVKPSWLEECHEKQTKVSEKPHLLHHDSTVNDIEDGKEIDLNQNDDCDFGLVPLKEACDKILSSIPFGNIFSQCSFFFLGYDKNLSTNIKDSIEDTSQQSECNDIENQKMLAKVIRHGMGTRYWKLTSDITHVIVNEYCDSCTLNAAKYLGEHHPNQPAILSPLWVLQSLSRQSLQKFGDFPARRREPKLPQPTPHAVRSLSSLSSTSNSKLKPKSKAKLKSSIFQGIIFCILPSNSSDNFFNKSVSNLQENILSNGGTLLSKRLVEALQKDSKSSQSSNRIICVVFIGRMVKNYTNRNALLAFAAKNKLCPLIPVNPNYIQCCIHERMEFLPDLFPILFQPQPYPFRRLPFDMQSPKDSKLEPTKKQTIIVAVSGFVGLERFGIVQILKNMGAQYTENMSKTNTHLICKKPEGLKFEKGLLWSLHVVSIEWLYHILKYGYEGDNGKIDDTKESIRNSRGGIFGCEERFRFSICDNTKGSTHIKHKDVTKDENDGLSHPEVIKKDANVDENDEKSFVNALAISATTSIDCSVNKDNSLVRNKITHVANASEKFLDSNGAVPSVKVSQLDSCKNFEPNTTEVDTTERNPSISEVDTEIKTSLEKLQNPVISLRNGSKRTRKRRRIILPEKAKLEKVVEENTNENADYDKEQIGKDENEDFEPENEDGLLGSLVESQAIWFAPQRG